LQKQSNKLSYNFKLIEKPNLNAFAFIAVSSKRFARRSVL